MIDHSKFVVAHDQGKQLCFVGVGGMSRKISEDFAPYHAILIPVENLHDKDKAWFSDKQFIVITSDVALQKRAVEVIDSQQGTYFSLIHKSTEISQQTRIGVGTYVNVYASTLPNEHAFIGNHCTIGSYVCLANQVVIHDFCHISPQCYINQCELYEGVVVGVQTKIAGQVNQKISIAPYSNIMMNSMITKSISRPATYFNNRYVNQHTSLDHRIL